MTRPEEMPLRLAQRGRPEAWCHGGPTLQGTLLCQPEETGKHLYVPLPTRTLPPWQLIVVLGGGALTKGVEPKSLNA